MVMRNSSPSNHYVSFGLLNLDEMWSLFGFWKRHNSESVVAASAQATLGPYARLLKARLHAANGFLNGLLPCSIMPPVTCRGTQSGYERHRREDAVTADLADNFQVPFSADVI
ncbi:hypothetical protein CEXT_508191 [Caerostris extrusa]|uniref:Uncharacterized protein n=1 Tax=Caerostris extrusa TaxID=172846 RepID=A0AAV4P8E4_CAEEX|nr:hypothetical protein CEXT_508191 [Caerostris extrusa]